MRCLFSTGGYYDLMYTDKIVKSVSKNPNKKKITTTYSGINSNGEAYRTSSDSYEYEIHTKLVYEDNSTEIIKDDLPIIEGWTVRSVYFNGTGETLLKKFIVENKYILSDSKTNPKTIIYGQIQDKLNNTISENKRSIILFFTVLLFLLTTGILLNQKFSFFEHEIIKYLAEKIPFSCWIVSDAFFLIASIVKMINIHIKNYKAKKEADRFLFDNEKIIEDTYEEYCKYIMLDRSIGRKPESIYELEINKDKYSLQILDKQLIGLEKIPICDKNGNPQTLTRLFYDDYTSEQFKEDLHVKNSDRTLRYIFFSGRKNELLREFIMESDYSLGGTNNKPKNIILGNFHTDTDNQIKRHNNSFFKRLSEIIIFISCPFIFGTIFFVMKSGGNITVKELFASFISFKFHKQIILGIIIELVLFLISHIHSHCRNLATKQQEELYRNQYERKINELQDLFNSYNTPVIEEKLKEMDNIPDIPF